METISLRTEIIEVVERHRGLDDAACDRLAASMKEIGLRQPISVRVVDMMVIDGHEVEGVPVLVAGRHRLEAARRLGWSHIDCIEVEDDPISAELWEIAENLHRSDLSKEQRDEHIRRYAELLERKREVSRQNDAKPASGPKGGRPEGVAAQVARDTGLSKRTVERALKPQPPQRRVIEVPEELDHDDQVELQVRSLMAAWNKACVEARDLFLERIDVPVMDRAA